MSNQNMLATNPQKKQFTDDLKTNLKTHPISLFLQPPPYANFFWIPFHFLFVLIVKM